MVERRLTARRALTGLVLVAALLGATTSCDLFTFTPPNAVRSPGNFAVVLCQAQTIVKGQRVTDTSQPQSAADYVKFFAGPDGSGGVAQWFSDISRGKASLKGTQVFGWKPIDKTQDELAAMSRVQKVAACAAASSSTRDYRAYKGIYAVFNEQTDDGAANIGPNSATINGRSGSWEMVVGDPLSMGVSFAAHEITHTLGFGHSFSDTPDHCYADTQPGEYCDNWDVMSNSSSINALTMEQDGWIPKYREINAEGGGRWTIDSIVAPKTTCGRHGCLAYPPLTRPISIYIPIKGEKDPRHHLTVELHIGSGWDAGIPAAVLVHEERVEQNTGGQVMPDGGRSRLLTAGVLWPGASKVIAGYTTHTSWCGHGVKVTVNSVSSGHADISVKYMSCGIFGTRPPVTVPSTVPATIPPITTTSTTSTTSTTEPTTTTSTTSTTTTTTRPIPR